MTKMIELAGAEMETVELEQAVGGWAIFGASSSNRTTYNYSSSYTNNVTANIGNQWNGFAGSFNQVQNQTTNIGNFANGGDFSSK
jgi:hypothetical protein